MIFFAEQNGKYIRGLTDVSGNIVYCEQISRTEYIKGMGVK